jgi:VPDSG-CTERM motif
MRNLSKTLFAIVATGLISCALFSQQAQAVTITGTITFGGSVKMNGNANTANTVTAWLNTHVESASGDFASFVGVNDPATFFAPWVFVNATPMLWQAGGFTFDLDAGATVIQGGGFLNISGTGTITGNGFDATRGTFTFTTQNPGSKGTFSFSAGTNAVPDGGSAVALLGIALAGIEVARRKIKAKTA